MNQPIPGLFDLLNILDSTCHPEAEFVLFGENLVFEFKGLSTGDGVLYSSLADAEPTSLTDEKIRSQIEEKIRNYLSVVIIVYSTLAKVEPTTQKPITEISGYSVHYQNEVVTYLKLAGEEVQKVALINPLTGEPKQPEPNEVFL
jgi:hypothetical protein